MRDSTAASASAATGSGRICAGDALRRAGHGCTVPHTSQGCARYRHADYACGCRRQSCPEKLMRLHCRSTIASLLLLVAPAAGVSAQRPNAEALKREVANEVASMQKLTQEIVDMVFSLGELGFQEFATLDYLTGILEREGFTVERGCAGMPTCYVATFRHGSG